MLVLALAGAAASPALAEPVDPGVILASLRNALSTKGPLAERVRVTIKPLGKPARSDEYLLKLDPGRPAAEPPAGDAPSETDAPPPERRAERAAAIWLELGDLRIHAARGSLVAVHTGDMTACYAVDFGGTLRADTLRKLLPPIPAPLIALALPDPDADAPNVSTGLTPYTPRITWTAAEATGVAGAEIVTMTGVRDPFAGERPGPDDTRVSMIIDATTSRPTRFTAVLPDAAELRLDISPTVPGNPATWPIRTDHRARVASLTDLRERRGDAAVAHAVPEMSLIDADWNAWDYRAAFRLPLAPGLPAPTHLALVFVRESSKSAFGAPSADAKAAEEELRRLESELNTPSPPPQPEPAPAPAARPVLAHAVVPVMLTMDDTSRRKVETAAKLAHAVPGAAPVQLIWAPSPEGTIERFAPGAAAVCVVVRADNSLAGIIMLDGRARDAAGIRADLRRALGLDPPAPIPE